MAFDKRVKVAGLVVMQLIGKEWEIYSILFPVQSIAKYRIEKYQCCSYSDKIEKQCQLFDKRKNEQFKKCFDNVVEQRDANATNKLMVEYKMWTH